MPNIRWLLALISAVHRFVYRATNGRLGSRMAGVDMLLLTTIGRKSGQERETPLLYVPDGDRFVVVASNAGDQRNPAWWLNLEAKPEARIQVGPERFAVRARRADPAETERLWPVLDAAYGSYPDYRKRANRDIPIVLLERA